jgi:hypothetical protein
MIFVVTAKQENKEQNYLNVMFFKIEKEKSLGK